MDKNEIITTGRKLQITFHSDASNFHSMIWSSVGFTSQTMSYVSAPAKPKFVLTKKIITNALNYVCVGLNPKPTIRIVYRYRNCFVSGT